jgi:hypothetical protein
MLTESIDRALAAAGRIRRHHALEHATMHILSRRPRDVTFYARASPRGLVVYGDLPTEDVVSAVTEALARLRNGEYQLAVHPNCGTNLVTAGTLTGLAALIVTTVPGMGKKRTSPWHLLSSLPLAILAATLALLVAQPLGQALQANVTTDAEMKNLVLKHITRHQQGPLVYHTVRTVG